MLLRGDMDDLEPSPEAPDKRVRILNAASGLLASGGVAALTTRTVAAAAGVQGPTLYRLFGEKRGLLHAVAEHSLAAFVAGKTSALPHPDPVEDLKQAWESYVTFGLANPAVFAIINEIGADAGSSPAAIAGIVTLRRQVKRIAQAGRLAIPIELAVAMIHAAGLGMVAALLASTPNAREPQLVSATLDAILSFIVIEPKGKRDVGLAPLAIALGARIGEAGNLTPGESLLLVELLSRLAEAPIQNAQP